MDVTRDHDCGHEIQRTVADNTGESFLCFIALVSAVDQRSGPAVEHDERRVKQVEGNARQIVAHSVRLVGLETCLEDFTAGQRGRRICRPHRTDNRRDFTQAGRRSVAARPQTQSISSRSSEKRDYNCMREYQDHPPERKCADAARFDMMPVSLFFRRESVLFE
ncbi:hypothetical protein FI667_g1664, partial [Globisporangium splendens]